MGPQQRRSNSAMLSALRRSAPVFRAASARSFHQARPVASKVVVPEQPDVFPAGELINDIDGANGLRREEIEAELMGDNRFEAEWVGPPGTKESPIVVESIASSRIVGIPSRDEHGEEGEIRWFRLATEDGVKEHHGQFFVLKQVADGVAPGYERAH